MLDSTVNEYELQIKFASAYKKYQSNTYLLIPKSDCYVVRGVVAEYASVFKDESDNG
jgi:hypothetical protein